MKSMGMVVAIAHVMIEFYIRLIAVTFHAMLLAMAVKLRVIIAGVVGGQGRIHLQPNLLNKSRQVHGDKRHQRQAAGHDYIPRSCAAEMTPVKTLGSGFRMSHQTLNQRKNFANRQHAQQIAKQNKEEQCPKKWRTDRHYRPVWDEKPPYAEMT